MSSGGPLRLSAEAVFEAHRGRIYRHIRSLVRDPGEAEDLTQETFLRAHRQLETLRDPAALAVWLYRIATHVSYDFLRGTSRRPSLARSIETEEGAAAEHEVVAEGPRLEQLIDQADMSGCVQRFLDDLPDAYRAAILLHDLQGLTDVETARLLGCTRGAVKIRLHRARTRLKAALRAGCEFSRDDRGVLVCGRKPPAD